MNLTHRETESTRRQVIKAMRQRLELSKPKSADYQVNVTQAAATTAQIMAWSRASLLPIAILAAIASAIRNIAAVYEIYDTTVSPLVAALAAICFAIASDGALFSLGLAQEHEKLKRIAAGHERQVTSLATITRSIGVRIGIVKPLPYAQMGDNLGTPILIAFGFILTANAYIGFQPLINQIGASNFQDFISRLPSAEASLQLTFIVDAAAVLFPPLMALVAGHQTARYAAEVAATATTEAEAHAADLATWRELYADPLASDEGQEMLEEALQIKLAAKIARSQSEPTIADEDTQEVPTIDPFPVPSNGIGVKARNGNG